MWHFLKRLRQLLNPNQLPHSNQARPQTTKAQPRPATDQAQWAYLPPVYIPKDIQPYQEDALVVVSYLDETGATLKKSDLIAGQVGQAFQLTIPEFPNHYLARLVNYHRYFLHARANIQLVYATQLAAPVIVYHYDEQHHLLKAPQYLLGRPGDAYTTDSLDLPQYRILRASVNRTGQFNQEVQAVVYLYRNLTFRWQTRYLKTRIQVLATKQTFKAPNDTPLPAPLPAQSIWQVFRKVCAADGSLWYDLGGQWITTSATKRVQQQPRFNPKALPSAKPLYQQTALIPGQRRGAVDFVPGKRVQTWSRPYGDFRTRLANGQIVNIVKGVILENNTVWYQLEDDSWLEETYLRLLPPTGELQAPIPLT
ncbi:MucBP domain-containing protein [Loigolactobacillus bifermentans]|jgi:hypothetical protein|uniref:MucBP domain-containing protein n=1 Tax=Loigolactobacillus bifermentans DSM 20003 TaxID=1423726 RepID=A0A0R1GK78_9LACO|nr:MucBP domain-containing protein [Loigolactobacillus bifermentans]KRK34416.1 hypothetical protein FC07_GL000625 [Loigolactobacillus bifermentans DSM 20003]